MGRTEQAERYERYAAECVRLAQNTADAAEKASLIQMAEAWRRIANGGEEPHQPSTG